MAKMIEITETECDSMRDHATEAMDHIKKMIDMISELSEDGMQYHERDDRGMMYRENERRPRMNHRGDYYGRYW